MADRATRLYLPPLRIDVAVREGVPRVVPLASLGRAIRAAALAADAPLPAAVGLVLTDDAELAALNRRHMGRRGPTDVLSFPLLTVESFAGAAVGRAGRTDSFVLPPRVRISLGDIAVSVERAIAQAAEGRGGQDSRTRWDARDEMLLLVIHGMLHLCGLDHVDPAEAEAMRAIERRLMADSETRAVLDGRDLLDSIRRSRGEAGAGGRPLLRKDRVDGQTT